MFWVLHEALLSILNRLLYRVRHRDGVSVITCQYPTFQGPLFKMLSFSNECFLSPLSRIDYFNYMGIFLGLLSCSKGLHDYFCQDHAVSVTVTVYVSLKKGIWYLQPCLFSSGLLYLQGLCVSWWIFRFLKFQFKKFFETSLWGILCDSSWRMFYVSLRRMYIQCNSITVFIQLIAYGHSIGFIIH
jgi:hypothetical protein